MNKNNKPKPKHTFNINRDPLTPEELVRILFGVSVEEFGKNIKSGKYDKYTNKR